MLLWLSPPYHWSYGPLLVTGGGPHVQEARDGALRGAGDAKDNPSLVLETLGDKSSIRQWGEHATLLGLGF